MIPHRWTAFIYGVTIFGCLNAAQSSDVTFLNEEDFQRAQSLTPEDLYGSSTGVLPQKDKWKGDIKGKAAGQKEFRRKGVFRNGVRMTYDKWPGGRIPYVLSQRYAQRERAILARAFQSYHEKTCIQFVPHNGERDYLYIGKIDGCFSDVGRAGGRQEVSLDDGCIEYDTAIHELMHAVGFWHEHERWDRDDYISILWQNIDRDAYDQFGKVNLFESDYYGETYDYFSIMHYDSKSFSKNGRNTIESKQPGMTEIIGRVKEFSNIDLRKINKMYNCPQARGLLPNGGGHHSGAMVPAQQQPPPPPPPVPQTMPVAPTMGMGMGGGPSNPSNPFNPSPVLPQQPLPTIATGPMLPPPAPMQPPTPFQPPIAPPRKCRDKATLCWRWVSRCTSPFFESVMREFCESTCGFCFGEQSGVQVPFSASAWAPANGKR